MLLFQFIDLVLRCYIAIIFRFYLYVFLIADCMSILCNLIAYVVVFSVVFTAINIYKGILLLLLHILKVIEYFYLNISIFYVYLFGVILLGLFLTNGNRYIDVDETSMYLSLAGSTPPSNFFTKLISKFKSSLGGADNASSLANTAAKNLGLNISKAKAGFSAVVKHSADNGGTLMYRSLMADPNTYMLTMLATGFSIGGGVAALYLFSTNQLIISVDEYSQLVNQRNISKNQEILLGHLYEEAISARQDRKVLEQLVLDHQEQIKALMEFKASFTQFTLDPNQALFREQHKTSLVKALTESLRHSGIIPDTQSVIICDNPGGGPDGTSQPPAIGGAGSNSGSQPPSIEGAAAVASQSFSTIRFNATRWGFNQLYTRTQSYARTIVLTILDWGRITWTAGDKGLFAVNNQKVRF